jgi:hypothetical protein
MSEKPVLVYVKGTQGVARVSKWLRLLLPAALLLVAPLNADAQGSADGVVVDGDDGPLAVASKVAEHIRGL